MLVYRVVRSPERRVFKIDVGTVPTEEIPNYMEAAQSKLKRAQVIDKQSGRVDLRYNPLSVDEDYFIPVRGSESGTSIDTLAGGQHVSDIADVEYIQKKLFAALKVPRAYLGYDEALSSKATLAQEDIRFSRTISRIQRVLLSELNKVAIIHLFTRGYEGNDLIDFTLRLSNPSTIAQQQKLELYRTKFEIAGAIPEGLVDRSWLRKELLGLSDDEIDDIEAGRIIDRIADMKLEAEELEGNAPGGGGGAFAGLGGGLDDIGGEEGEEDLAVDSGGGELGGEEGGEEEAGEGGEEDDEDVDLFAARQRDDEDLISDDDKAEAGSLRSALIDEEDKPGTKRGPVKTSDRVRYNRSRHRTHGASKTMMPDLASMVKPDNDPFGAKKSKNPFKEEKLGGALLDEGRKMPRMSSEVISVLNSLGKRIGIDDRKRILAEGLDEIVTEKVKETSIDDDLILIEIDEPIALEESDLEYEDDE